LAARGDGSRLVRNFDTAVVVGQTDDWTAITRHGEVVIAHHDTVIQPDDHVIVFLYPKKAGQESRKAVPGRFPLPLRGRP
jgi:trk system potassium uptake protein TrkA